jgi:CHAT domain-containing protein
MLDFNRQFYIRLLLVFISSLLITFGYHNLNFNGGNHNIVNAQTPDINILVNEGVNNYHNGNFQGAIADWENALKLTNTPHTRVIILENLARIYQKIGQNTESINKWKQAIAIYEQLNNLSEKGRILIELAQAYTLIGQPQQAIAILCRESKENLQENIDQILNNCQEESAFNLIKNEQNLTIALLGSLGEAYRLTGEYKLAIKILDHSLNQEINSDSYQLSLLKSRANSYFSLGKYNENRKNVAEKLSNKSQEMITPLQTNIEKYYSQSLRDFQKMIELITLTESQSISKVNQTNDNLVKLQIYLSLIPLYQIVESNHFQLETMPMMSSQETILKIKEIYPIKQIDIILTTNESEAEKTKQIREILGQVLPISSETGYETVKLAEFLTKQLNLEQIISFDQCVEKQEFLETKTLLNIALSTTKNDFIQNNNIINDHRLASFAYGNLGKLFQICHNDNQALIYTQQAQLSAQQNLQVKDSLYFWQWQTGIILNKQAQQLRQNKNELEANLKENQAINSYQQAIDTLNEIRSDILIAQRELQFDFIDRIESLYREFAQLRLTRATRLQNNLKSINNKVNQKQINNNFLTKNNLKQLNRDLDIELDSAVKTIDYLKLAQLQNYFGNDCNLKITTPQEIDKLLGENTVVFNSIIFEDQTAIIVTFPDRSKKFTLINQNRQDLENKINNFRKGITNKSDRNYQQALKIGTELYNDIITPFADDLKAENTLVFIQDRILRSIPMAALYNQNEHKFLIEKYPIANTPSLEVIITKKEISPQRRALILALTTGAQIDQQIFSPLTQVDDEIKAVKQQFPDSKSLVNNFDQNTLKTELNEMIYPIIHIATHGQFSAIREDSFLVTGNNQKLTLRQLENDIRNSQDSNLIELLALTACETAVGDDRASLGFAGVALQAGVRSAIASLWSVNDQSTQILVTEFYQQWKQGKTKVKALQLAMIKVINENKTLAHPYYWSPFILIGNWL